MARDDGAPQRVGQPPDAVVVLTRSGDAVRVAGPRHAGFRTPCVIDSSGVTVYRAPWRSIFVPLDRVDRFERIVVEPQGWSGSPFTPSTGDWPDASEPVERLALLTRGGETVLLPGRVHERAPGWRGLPIASRAQHLNNDLTRRRRPSGPVLGGAGPGSWPPHGAPTDRTSPTGSTPPPAAPLRAGRRRQRWRRTVPWLAGGLAAVALAAGVAAMMPLAQPADDVSTGPGADRETTTTAAPRPARTTTSAATSPADLGAVLSSDQLQVGDCFDDTATRTSTEVEGKITRVDCASPHDGEVFARATLPGEPDAAFPGDDEVALSSERLCLDEFEPYVGAAFSDSRWDFAYYVPSTETWYGDEDRLVICTLIDPTWSKTEGSKRDSGT